MCFLRCLLILFVLTLQGFASSHADEGNVAKARASLLFEDDFEGRSQLGDGYRTGRGMEDAWTIRDGVLFGEQIRDDHGSTMRKQMNFDDLHVAFDFRFNGGSRFNFVIDDNNDKTVHAGHVARASVSPKRMSISDDKVGSMNLKVREMRQNKSLAPAPKKKLDEILRRTQASAKVNLASGEWHQMEVIIQGTVMTVRLDGEKVLSLDSSGFAHPTKTQFGMTVNGSSIDFDNLKVYSTD